MVNNEAIKVIIHDLKSQDHPNYTVTAKKFNINIITLTQHFKNKNIFLAEDHSKNQKFFTNVQKFIFIEHIKKFVDLNISPNLQIIKNLVMEAVKYLINECWIKCF